MADVVAQAVAGEMESRRAVGEVVCLRGSSSEAVLRRGSLLRLLRVREIAAGLVGP